MTRTQLSPTPFAYIDCDVAAGQTLVEWRRERDAERRAARRRAFRVPRLVLRLRPIW